MIFVGSLKFSPVFRSLCAAFGKACEREGHEVTYLFSKRYNWMLDEEMRRNAEFIGNTDSISSMIRDALDPRIRSKIKRLIHEKRPTAIYLLNYHFLNHHFARYARSVGAKLIYHVHEPYVKEKHLHGGFQKYWLHLFENLQGRLLQKTSVAIVSSEEAFSLFRLRYRNYSGEVAQIPLLFDDLGMDVRTLKRKYVTFVGPPIPAKNPYKFLDIVEHSERNDIDFQFLITSHTNQSLDPYRGHARLELFTKSQATDQEFGEIMSRSIAVVTPYTRETQSAVVLTAFMHGTPVVSSDVGGMTEFVNHKDTGFLLSPHAPPEEWIIGLEFVRENFDRLSKNCRDVFERKFSGRQWDKHLSDLLS